MWRCSERIPMLHAKIMHHNIFTYLQLRDIIHSVTISNCVTAKVCVGCSLTEHANKGVLIDPFPFRLFYGSLRGFFFCIGNVFFVVPSKFIHY